MGSKHTAARELIKHGIFTNLTSFDEFLARAKTLPNTKLYGDALEVLVEGLLHTHREFETQDVHQVGYIPQDILKRMKFPKHFSLGLDGVQVTKSGTVIPYQVKNYNKRSLTFTDVSSFLASTGVAKNSMIFTSATKLNKNIIDREGLIGVTSSFFENLTREDFRAFSGWLFDRPVTVYGEPENPRDWQIRCDKALVREFRKRDRATIVVGCGGGKSYAGWMLLKRIRNKARRAGRGAVVYVAVPTNNLLGQIREEYRGWGGDSYYELVVSSDSKISTMTGVDEDWELSDLVRDSIFPATTNIKEIRDFLNMDTKALRVVFVTYHSMRTLAEARKRSKVKEFDLGIFDEAHRSCARMFSFGLSNKELPTSKRLFMTATPRNLTLRDDAGRVFVNSMDDETVYGRKAFTITQRELIDEKVTLPIHIMLTFTNNAQVDATLLKHGKSEISKSKTPVDVDWIAAQVGYISSMKRTKSFKSMSFWRTVEQTQNWMDEEIGYLRLAPKGSIARRVVGIQSTESRMSHIRDIRNATTGMCDLATVNAGAEGLNLPSVNLMFFPTPKHSVRAITQSVGRGGRKADGKTEAWAVLATHVHPNETPFEAMKRSGMDTIFNVIDKLMNEDDSLVETINELRYQIGRGGRISTKSMRKRIVINAPFMDEDEIAHSIYVEIAMRCGESWFERLGQFDAWQAKHGNNSYPTIKESPTLYWWAANNRKIDINGVRGGHLPENQRRELEKRDFDFNPRQSRTEKMIEALDVYQDINGENSKPVYNSGALGRWINQCNTRYQNGKLNKNTADALLKRGVIGENFYDMKLQENLKALDVYQAKHGAGTYPPNNTSLGGWLSGLRSKHKNGQLEKEILVELKRRRIVMDVFWQKFLDNVANLKASKKALGRFPTQREEGGHFLNAERNRAKKEEYSVERKRIMDKECRGWNADFSYRNSLGKNWNRAA